MFKPFANSARVTEPGPPTWRTWVGLVTVPLIIAGVLTWSFWDPMHHHGDAKAAVVNTDEPAEVNGQTVPLGRELAGELTHDDDSGYDWVLTDAEDAADGLADGDYAAVATIPKDFSADATSTSGDDPAQASRATLDITTSKSAGVVDPVASKDVAKATLETVNQQMVETYLDNIYVAFNTMHEQLGEAADGSTQLAAGTGKLSSAADQLSTGADQLATGTGELADGSAQLSNGLSKAKKNTQNLPAQTKKLAAGARQVANGNRALADKVVPLANKVIKAIDAMPSAKTSAAKFTKLADRCAENGGTPRFCAQLSQAAKRFSENAGAIDAKTDSIRAAAVQTKKSVRALAGGAEQVAAGNKKLAAGMPSLVRGISDAADGAEQLNTGVQKTDEGTHKLASGTRQLASGASEVDDGADDLAAGLGKAQDQMPTYSEDERDNLKQVAAQPASMQTSDGPDMGKAAVALFVVLGLWAGALAVYVLTRAVPPSVLRSRAATWRIVVSAAVPGTSVAVITAALLTALLLPFLDLGLAASAAFFLVLLLASCTFTAVNFAVAAILRRPGRLASLAVLVLTLATGVISTVPGPLDAVAGVLPTHGALVALRAVVTGASGGLGGIAELLAWLALATAATIFVTDRRRSMGGKELRLPSHPRAHAAALG